MTTTEHLDKITQGDCLELMKQLDDNSIDSIITDCPYGISFMNKHWDYNVPKVEAFAEMLRVAKPGATLLCFGGTRTWHRIAVNIEDAGWTIKDSICWLYGQGFPKATDISKQLDKRAGAEREVLGIDKVRGNAPSMLGRTDPNSPEYDGSTFGVGTTYITAPSTPSARLWNGWKSHGLKPSFEPIILAMKPNDGSYAENALKWGVGGLNIDGCRIGTETRITKGAGGTETTMVKGAWASGNGKDLEFSHTGRFPANTILGCACEGEHVEDCPVKMLDEQSGVLKSGAMDSMTKGYDPSTFNTYGKQYVRRVQNESSVGTASRFFYTAKASRSERNEGCEELEEKPIEIQQPHNSKDLDERYAMKSHNHHPTVKPLSLMEYLCKLTRTPTGGIVLDPYAGSGTTLIAARKTNRPFIGFEIESDYVKIAEARLKPYLQQTKLG